MKNRLLAFVVTLNVLLFGFGLYFLNRAGDLASNRGGGGSERSPEKQSFKHPRSSAAEKPRILTKEKLVYVTNAFNWSQVESADYREYITNLRKVGCPEATIRDIVITDIMRLYAARRGQFYHNGREFKFWETNEKRKLNARQLEEREKQLAQIDKEIPMVLRELLGVNYEREINKYFVDTNEDERRLNFISEDKRSRVLALRDEFEGKRERLLREAADGKLSESQRAEIDRIEADREEALSKILSREELQEFELRTSDTADRLREELIGFNPSAEEFRDVYTLQKSLDSKFRNTDSSDPTVQQEKEAEQARIDEELRKRLGDQRFAEYQLARNPDYREACLFSELYELPQATGASIYEIKQVAEQEKARLLANRDVQPAQREEALKLIRAETEKSLLQLLGTKVLSSYSQTSGQWLQTLGSAN